MQLIKKGIVSKKYCIKKVIMADTCSHDQGYRVVEHYEQAEMADDTEDDQRSKAAAWSAKEDDKRNREADQRKHTWEVPVFTFYEMTNK